METLRDMFEETLKDVYFAENAILKALPKMAEQAQSDDLKETFNGHLEETKEHVVRLDRIFELLGKKAQGKECPALKGLVQETEELISEAKNPNVLDAGLIGCAQAVEHYEIARYGTLKAWAEQLGLDDAAELLEQTLEEEKETDEALTELAVASVNDDAAGGEEEEDDEDEDEEEREPEDDEGEARKAKPKISRRPG